MKSFLRYTKISVREFKKLSNTGGGVFDKYRALAIAFLKYVSNDFEDKIKKYDDMGYSVSDINLVDIMPTEYKFLVKPMNLKLLTEYYIGMVKHVGDFSGNTDTLKVMVGVSLLKFVLLVKLVDIYLTARVNMQKSGIDVSTSKLTLSDIGIGRSTFRYYKTLIEFDKYSIDDWEAHHIDSNTGRYYYSVMKRILTILLSQREG